MSETPTLVSFYEDWAPTGAVSKDGLPVFERATFVRMSRPPYLQVTRLMEDRDEADYPEPWKLYLKEQKARTTEDGFPLANWIVCTAADLKMLAGHDIYTVEQLAKLAGSRDSAIPPQIRELADRAKRMIEMQRSTGQYEAIVSQQKGEIEALTETLQDARNTIAGLKARLEQYEARDAGGAGGVPAKRGKAAN